MKKYLISGIPPSESGVGYLMYLIEKLALDNSFQVIYPKYSNISLRKLLANPIKLVYEVYKRFKCKVLFKQDINTIKNSEIILIHPQTIGFNEFLSLIQTNTIIKWYVMDNSFFCIESYNVLNGKECINCLNDLDNCNSQCKPFPINYNKRVNLEYLKVLKKYASKILFYAQNSMQERLLKEFYGENINVRVLV